MEKTGEIIIYRTEDKETQIEVIFEQDTVWLTQVQMATLFKQTRQNISLHLNNLYKEKELLRDSTIKESLIVQTEGGRKISRKIDLYNLDVLTVDKSTSPTLLNYNDDPTYIKLKSALDARTELLKQQYKLHSKDNPEKGIHWYR